jgi:hypothetical protein
MRIVNLANRMDIFRRKPVGCGFPRTPWSGLRWRKHSPGLVKIQEKSQGDKPSGSGGQVFTQALGPLQRIEMERFAGTLLQARLN